MTILVFLAGWIRCLWWPKSLLRVCLSALRRHHKRYRMVSGNGGETAQNNFLQEFNFFYRQDFLGSGMLTESLCQITTNQKTQTCELDVSPRRLHGGRGRAGRTARWPPLCGSFGSVQAGAACHHRCVKSAVAWQDGPRGPKPGLSLAKRHGDNTQFRALWLKRDHHLHHGGPYPAHQNPL